MRYSEGYPVYGLLLRCFLRNNKDRGENRSQLKFLCCTLYNMSSGTLKKTAFFQAIFFDSPLLDYLWAHCIPVPPRHGAAFWLKNAKRLWQLVYSYRWSWLKVRSSLTHSVCVWFIALFIILFNSIIALLHVNLVRSSYRLALYEGEQMSTFARFKRRIEEYNIFHLAKRRWIKECP